MSGDPRPQLIECLRDLNPSAPPEQLRTYADWLYMTSVLGTIGDLPRARKVGSAKACRQLVQAARRAEELATKFRLLSSDALRAFERVEPRGELHPLMFANALLDFATSADFASTMMEPAPPYRGNRQRVQPRQVAKSACKVFTLLTGKKGGRIQDPYGNKKAYGPLHDFVGVVFKLFSIDASADGQLKSILSPTRNGNIRR